MPSSRVLNSIPQTRVQTADCAPSAAPDHIRQRYRDRKWRSLPGRIASARSTSSRGDKAVGFVGVGMQINHSASLLSRSALAITETELKVMAALAITGLSSKAKERIQHAGRERHAERVIDEREEQVLADVAHA